MEVFKSFIELLSSIFFLFAAIIGANAFMYKHDSSIRDLYIENCKKIREVLGYVYRSGNINPEMHNLAKEAFQEASIYLHADIIKFTDDVLMLLIKVNCCQSKLDGLEVGPKRSLVCNNQAQYLIELDELNKKSMDVYRKHIVQDSMFKKAKEWLKSDLNQSWVLNKIIKLKIKSSTTTNASS